MLETQTDGRVVIIIFDSLHGCERRLLIGNLGRPRQLHETKARISPAAALTGQRNPPHLADLAASEFDLRHRHRLGIWFVW